ncbi:4-hydroxybenzoate octaprenyltransferase [Halovulum dunhuangense]|uniref:4-hydroxybenzoate octaprenyltransferase n=1 Tax=Halovulum dunhuangense TaxID=1505036 RepID=A0A849KRG9_9RHOB|nr:4-hydroxybenzoate octaprenyltransferase [Halovulum dunhuangense]NNU79673.1 4-hydroxybenzoate octaprenyltransferase [Halovulum dunhuangense]
MIDLDHIQNGGPDGRVADATDRNWVDRHAPRATRPYLRLSRADRPIGTWLLLLPCWWGLSLAIAADPASAGWGDAWIALACALGAFLMRGAGCTWNDLADREIDAAVARTRSRPLPSGQVSPRGAFVWMCAQALIAFGILLTFNGFAILLACASLGFVAIYPFAKRFTWWPQVFLGLAFNWGALVGWAAHTGSLSAAPVALYLAGIAWTLFYDTIYAHQDKEDDALIGVKSTARLFGGATARWLFWFLVVAVLLMAWAAAQALLAKAGGVALIAGIGAAWAFGWHLAWQIRHLDIDDNPTCLRLFRANREAGLIPVAGFLLAALLGGMSA